MNPQQSFSIAYELPSESCSHSYCKFPHTYNITHNSVVYKGCLIHFSRGSKFLVQTNAHSDPLLLLKLKRQVFNSECIHLRATGYWGQKVLQPPQYFEAVGWAPLPKKVRGPPLLVERQWGGHCVCDIIHMRQPCPNVGPNLARLIHLKEITHCGWSLGYYLSCWSGFPCFWKSD